MFRRVLRLRSLDFVLISFLLASSVFGQDTTSPAPAIQSAPAAIEPNPESQKLEPQKPEPQSGQGASNAETETKITPQQAEQLFRDVDTILDFASKDTSLPIKHGIKR